MSIIKNKISNQVLWVKVNRPEVRNAIDIETMEELDEVISEVEANDEIQAFVLSGTGAESFISGGDLIKFHSIKSKDKAVEMSRRMHHILNRLEKLPCWTIAAINGNAYGGGIEMMLAFDFRLSTPEAQFGFTQGRFFLVPGWGGLTRLIEKVGKAKALQLLGKSEIIPAQKAQQIDLIEELLPAENFEEAVLEWLRPLTKNDRKFIQTLKAGANNYSDHRKKALAAEIEPFSELWIEDKHLKRVENFLNRKDK